MKLLKEVPQKDGLSTEYICGLTVTGGWATRVKKHKEFTETVMGKYILELESYSNAKIIRLAYDKQSRH